MTWIQYDKGGSGQRFLPCLRRPRCAVRRSAGSRRQHERSAEPMAEQQATRECRIRRHTEALTQNIQTVALVVDESWFMWLRGNINQLQRAHSTGLAEMAGLLHVMVVGAPWHGRPASRRFGARLQGSAHNAAGPALKAMADQTSAAIRPSPAVPRSAVACRVPAGPPKQPLSARQAAPPRGCRAAPGPRSSRLYDQAYAHRCHPRGRNPRCGAGR